MDFEWDEVARENATHYRDADPQLWKRMADVLEAIKTGDARARERPLFDHAWWVTVTVPGRDDEYAVVWSPVTGRDAVAIQHLGQAPKAR